MTSRSNFDQGFALEQIDSIEGTIPFNMAPSASGVPTSSGSKTISIPATSLTPDSLLDYVKKRILSVVANNAGNLTFESFKDALSEDKDKPNIINNSLFYYLGAGEMASFDLQPLVFLISVSAIKQKGLARIANPLSGLECTLKSMDSLSYWNFVIHYGSGASLRIIDQRDFSDIIKLIRTRGVIITHPTEKRGNKYILSSNETFSQLLSSLEEYSVTGIVNPKYSFFLVSTLGLSRELLSKEGKRRALSQDLGL